MGTQIHGRACLAIAAVSILLAARVNAGLSAQSAWNVQGFGAGVSVGTAGDVNCDGVSDLIVGSPDAGNGNGKVSIWYGHRALPAPSAPADWTVNGSSAERLGAAVAAGNLDGDSNHCDDVIVGAPGSASALNGSVYVFTGRPTQGPATAPAWSAIGFSWFSSQFGASVASGDLNRDGIADLIVGNPGATGAGAQFPGEGAVLVWLGSQSFASDPAGTPANADWIALGRQTGAHLGASVASAGDVDGDGDDEILAGAPLWDVSSNGSTFADAGTALMWFGSPVIDSAADGTPANASWRFELAETGALVGSAVAGVGDVDGDGFADVLVGAPFRDNPATPGSIEGLVVGIRGRSGGPLSNTIGWLHSGTSDQGQLGASLAAAGDVNGDGFADYLVGEFGAAGRALLVLGRPSFPFTPSADLVYDEPDNRFGWAVATAGDWNGDGFSDVVAAASLGSGTQGTNHAFVYLGSGATLASAPSSTAVGAQGGAGLGVGISFAGDVDHDGLSDFVAGAPYYESTASEDSEGGVFVYYGNGNSELLLPESSREGNQAGAQLGFSVSSAGDVNGDGYDDVIAGAPFFDVLYRCAMGRLCIAPDSGEARLYLGGPGGLSFSSQLLDLTQTGAQFGYSVASAGDVNGDGFADVIVGAPQASSGGFTNDGRVHLYLGSASGVSAAPWTVNGGQNGAHFGIAVAGAGDVNRDGFSDVIVGADGYNGGTGAAFVYLGVPPSPGNPTGGLAATPVRVYLGSLGSSFGLAVGSAGDVNRDGYSDVVVGAPNVYTGSFGSGEVTVYHGGPAGPSPTPSATLHGDAASGRFGSGVSGAGDVDGDGYGDLIAGDQWHFGSAGFAQGKAYVFHGGVAGLSTTAKRTFEDCPHSYCDFGRNVSGGHDVNGDGFSDVVIAAYRYTQSAADQGAVFVHLGNDGRGAALRPLQSVGFGGSPLALLGGTSGLFEGSLDLHSPAGRTRVRLELESKPLGQDFDGQSSASGAFLDNGITPRGALSIAPGAPGSVHQWRVRLHSASPLFGRGRWVSLAGNAPREWDVRVLPEPALLASLATGFAALAGLARRRASRVY